MIRLKKERRETLKQDHELKHKVNEELQEVKERLTRLGLEVTVIQRGH